MDNPLGLAGQTHTDALGELHVKDHVSFDKQVEEKAYLLRKAQMLQQECGKTDKPMPYNQVEDLQQQMKRMEEHYSVELRKARIQVQEMEREMLQVYRVNARLTQGI